MTEGIIKELTPREPINVTLPVKVTKSTLEFVRKMAKDNNTTASAVVRFLLERGARCRCDKKT